MNVSPMRLLLNVLHAKSGGGLTYLAAMLPRLAQAKNVEVHLLFHANQKALLGAPPPGVIAHEASFKDGFIRRLIWEQVRLPLLAWRIADVTFSPANFGPLLAPRPAVLLRNALEVENHDRRLARRVYWLVLRLMTWLSLAVAPRAIAVSGFARERLGFCFAKKVEIVHHGVEHGLFAERKQERQDFVLAVGDVTIQKNYETLIRAVALVPDLKLVIAGQDVDQDHADALRRLVVELSLSQRVRFLGRVEPARLAELYAACRLFAFPSTVETFGNPLLEAMASGCVILCSHAAAMPEIAGDGARFVEPLDHVAWANEMKLLLSDDGLRGALQAAAIERARLFSWDKTAAETLAVLRKAAAAPRPVSAAIPWIWVAIILAAYFMQFVPLLRPILAVLTPS